MYKIILHKKIIKDIKSFSNKDRKLIFFLIEEKILNNPEKVGKPLRGALETCLSLRSGNYRVIYKVIKKEIYIACIGHRKDVYEKAINRISKS